MNTRQRNFLLLVTLVSAAATPALGQPQGPATIPDLSGIWTHSIPGFEPLSSGPTALINQERRENGTGNILKLAGDYTNPILNPKAAEIQCAKIAELKKKRDNRQVARALDNLKQASEASANIMPPVMEAVRAYATLGEICGVWRQLYGLWRIPLSV
jgi:hypothetical protein